MLRWEFAPTSKGNFLAVSVRRVGEEFPVAMPVNIANAGQESDISYIYEEGTFYLDIASLGGAWSISVGVAP